MAGDSLEKVVFVIHAAQQVLLFSATVETSLDAGDKRREISADDPKSRHWRTHKKINQKDLSMCAYS